MNIKNLLYACLVLLNSIPGLAQNIGCGMRFDNSGFFYFASVDMTTGKIISQTPLPSVKVVISGTSMINPLTDQYIVNPTCS